ncbi:hypothetical protein KP509_32G003700 [Ceratopteris richardii]|uniref:Uncharacterized protein n=1 Tax=Ceratopteris richardii TaxID=49495 RepID=A0A8T2QR82_CERRI|nr:hypothetical protein KP509_32G003700 [Ceratopteris richardii]
MNRTKRPLDFHEASEVISMAMKNVIYHKTSGSTVVPFHCNLAPAYGKLNEKGAIKSMDEQLKIIIAGTTRSMTKLIEERKGKDIEWSQVVEVMSQNPLLEPCDDVTERSDKYIKHSSGAFKFDGSPDETIVKEVEAWFHKLISDEDVLKDTKIHIDVYAKIVAESGARIQDFVTLFYKHSTHEEKCHRSWTSECCDTQISIIPSSKYIESS